MAHERICVLRRLREADLDTGVAVLVVLAFLATVLMGALGAIGGAAGAAGAGDERTGVSSPAASTHHRSRSPGCAPGGDRRCIHRNIPVD